MATRRARQYGVTLIEQVMTVAVLGILVAVALPPLARLLQHNQVQSAQAELIAALRYARGRAAVNGQATLLCPSRDGTHCSDARRWESGWLVGHDPDRTGQPAGTPLRARAGYAGITILGDSGRRHIRFRADGSAGGSTNTLRICRPGHAEAAWVVVVANSGRIRGARATAEQAAACAAAQ